YVDFRCRNRGRGAAVQVALEIPDRPLTRRIIAEGDVHVRIDEAWNGGHSVRIDDDVGALDRRRRRGAHRNDTVRVSNNRVAGDERTAPVARNNVPEIDDGELHDPGADALATRSNPLRKS